jgi:SAM-dependent methyltransferase
VQLQEFTAPSDIFTEYAYFSSFSDCWIEHCRAFEEDFTKRLRLGAGSRVVEIAGNDGYLLRFFKHAGIDVLGVEPARNVAAAAEKDGIPTIVEFSGTALADRMGAAGQRADLVIGNNVLAHMPDLNDLVEVLRLILRPGGCCRWSFRIFCGNQFDTIYHEHFSYFRSSPSSACSCATGYACSTWKSCPLMVGRCG